MSTGSQNLVVILLFTSTRVAHASAILRVRKMSVSRKKYIKNQNSLKLFYIFVHLLAFEILLVIRENTVPEHAQLAAT